MPASHAGVGEGGGGGVCGKICSELPLIRLQLSSAAACVACVACVSCVAVPDWGPQDVGPSGEVGLDGHVRGAVWQDLVSGSDVLRHGKWLPGDDCACV